MTINASREITNRAIATRESLTCTGAPVVCQVGALVVTNAPAGQATDGDDYIEGGGGKDVVFGGLGRDDIIGGSSALFLERTTIAYFPDDSDLIFGGTGSDDVQRRDDETEPQLRARDSDTIVGDNGTIYRVVNGGLATATGPSTTTPTARPSSASPPAWCRGQSTCCSRRRVAPTAYPTAS
jgi:Ca2+-binding RTX toxin-like protein